MCLPVVSLQCYRGSKTFPSGEATRPLMKTTCKDCTQTSTEPNSSNKTHARNRPQPPVRHQIVTAPSLMRSPLCSYPSQIGQAIARQYPDGTSDYENE